MLRAKSPFTVHGKTIEKGLAEHCREVMDAFEALFGMEPQPSRLGREWLRFFKLPTESFPLFHRCGTAAGGLHDVGKANDGFQEIVSPDANKTSGQVLRHEHLSGLLLFIPEVRKWLDAIPGLDVEVVLSAVMSHHLQFSHNEFAANLGLQKAVFSVLSNDPEFQVVFNQVAERLNGGKFEIRVPAGWSLEDEGNGAKLRERIQRDFHRLKRSLFADQGKSRLRLLMAVKAGVILADAAGSGLPRNSLPISTWIREQFAEDRLLSAEFIRENVINPRIRQIEAKSGKAFEEKDFQKAAAHLPDRALILAGCGSGKTMAAWYWIENQLRRRSAARVIFLYPTRATATEGFKDYVAWAPEADASLISGTAAYELEGMFDQPGDGRREKNYTVEHRLYSLAYWQRRIFSATVDQFFGFLQHAYGSVCLMPVLADSVVVVDEAHSFDRKLFAALKTLLEWFDIPVLCMTASLPRRRRQELERLCLRVFPGEDKFSELEGAANHPRYKVKKLSSDNDAFDIATEAFAAGKRVLWVVNRVDPCQKLARSLNALCYHSRFTLDDRKNRHTEVVGAFKQKSRPVIAVTTQVCEMSLDLDADILISEEAPLTAMIQRMGRCNRGATPGEAFRGEVYFYTPEKNAPYDNNDLVGVPEFIERIDAREVGQAFLEELLEELGPDDKEKDSLIRFISDGPWAMSEPLRDIEEFAVPAVLDNRIGEYLQLRAAGKPVDGLLVAVPRKLAESDSRLGKYVFRAPHSHYCSKYGFAEEPQGAFEIC